MRTVQESIDNGRMQKETGPNPSRNALQTVTLLDAITEFKFDAWDPKNQRPELWSIYNAQKKPGERGRHERLDKPTHYILQHTTKTVKA